jgi:hypothetical protein
MCVIYVYDATMGFTQPPRQKLRACVAVCVIISKGPLHHGSRVDPARLVGSVVLLWYKWLPQQRCAMPKNQR